MDFLDRNEFNNLARKYIKQLTCYNQLCILMLGQLSNRERLIDVVLATQAHASKAYHLGFGKHASKSSLADANTKRDYRIFDRGYNEFKPMKWKRWFQSDSGILSYAVGYIAVQLTMEKYPDKIRRVIYWDDANMRKFIFFTNTLIINLITISELYRNRWQIKLFFKWIKQHLKIKKFWETSENAVHIQIYSAIKLII